MKFLKKFGIDVKKTGILAGILAAILLGISLYDTLTLNLKAGYVVIHALISILSGGCAALFIGATKAKFKKYFPKSNISVFNAFKNCVFILIIFLVVKDISRIDSNLNSYIILYDEFEFIVRGLLIVAFTYVGSYLLFVLVGFIFTNAVLLEKNNTNPLEYDEEEVKQEQPKVEIKELSNEEPKEEVKE